VIWEPFILALVLGIIVSAGLYFAYLWPSVEPVDDESAPAIPASPAEISPPPVGEPDVAGGTDVVTKTDDDAATDVAASPAP
jgi:hypothetical protein